LTYLTQNERIRAMNKEQTDRCKECKGEMVEVGGTGKSIIKFSDNGEAVIGGRYQKLYQCKDCKTITIK